MMTSMHAYREKRPCPSLRSLVRCYWTLIGPIPEEKRTIRILPDGCMDLIFDLRGGLAPAHAPDTMVAPSAFLSGIMHTHAQIRHSGDVVAGIRFRPGGAFMLPAPATDFANMNVPVEDILPDLAPMLDFLREAPPDSEELMTMLEAHLLDRLKIREPESCLTLEAATRLSRNGAAISIHTLADDMGVNQKTLERSFQRIVGMKPKKFARVNRLVHSTRLLSSGKLPLAEAALIAGYTDQSHFTREFKQLTGLTPGQFRRRPDTVDFLQYSAPKTG